ncbi:MAG: alpha-2-macroglobulin family protein, partial [Flammeovirgaceae bacterium]
MKKYTNHRYYLLCLLFLSACNWGGQPVEITYKNFDEIITERQNLRFVFDKDLAQGITLNDWRDENYATFEPAVKGKFRWVDQNELEFSPLEGFAPSTTYQINFTDELIKHVDEKFRIGDQTSFEFHTEYLGLTASNVAWVLNSKNEPTLLAELNFNYPVEPSDLNQLLHVTREGEEVKYEIATPQLARAIELNIAANPDWESKDLKFEIAKGLGLKNSDYVAGGLESSATIPAKAKFEVVDVVANYLNTDPFIKVSTSQMILSKNLTDLVSISPALKVDIEKSNDGLVIKGNFEVGKDYKVTVKKELKGIFQKALESNFSKTVVFGEIAPSMSFSDKKAVYLTAAGNREIGIQIVNVPSINVKVWKIYENNILEFLRRNRMMNSYFDNYDRRYFYGNTNYGDVVFETDMETANMKTVDGLKMLNLNFKDANAFKGIYLVEVKSNGELWLKQNKLVAISDIGLIAKQAENDIYVWANSIKTAESLEGTEISLFSTNNQKVLKKQTDANGFVKFENIKESAPNFNIQMVTARKGTEFNFMHFRQNPVATAAFEVGGYYKNQSGLQAFIYGDRNLYRPGEMAHIKTIVRDQDWNNPGELPVKIKVLAPNGKEFLSKKGMLTKEGSYETSFQFPVDVVTGTFYAELFTGNDVLLNSYAISVEEFMPDRIKVMVNMDKEEVRLGDPFKLSGQAFNLFGPPAVGRNYDANLYVSRKNFSPKGFNDYNFHIQGKNKNFEAQFRTGKTDDAGKYEADFQLDHQYKNMGLLSGEIYTTVFDETGRPVSRKTNVEIITQDVFYGIQNFPYYIKARQPLAIPFVAVNKDGKVLDTQKASVKVLRYDWYNVLEKDHRGSYRYVSKRKEKVLVDKVIDIKGKATQYTFVPGHSGRFEVRISEEGAESYVSRNFYAYGWGQTRATSFQVDREGKVMMELDKENYQVGETAKILFKLPFEGKLLVTVERENIIKHYEFAKTDKKAKELSIQLTEDMLPNAYITATLIKPITDNAIPLTVAHGFQPILVEKKSNQIVVEVIAPQKSRAKKRQSVLVKTDRAEQDIEVTVAVVDEGILQIKNYQTPKPYNFFYQKRALQVESYDLYPRLFPEYAIKKQGFGSGEGARLGKRVNPLANKRVKLVSFWSGTLKTNAKGEVRYEFDIPQFSGDLRVMAVATKGTAFGSGYANMKVADPVVISAALPRFASPKDQMNMPVTLTNTTNTNMDVTAKVSVKGEVKLVGAASRKVEIPANSEQTIRFQLTANQAIGQAAVTVEVDNGQESFSNLTELTVRPTTSLLKTNGSGVVASGKPIEIDFKKDYLTASIDAKLLISKSPAVEFTAHLAYLVRYPHGCVEQTTSAAFPQLYFAELAEDLNKVIALRGDPDFYVGEAVRKLQTMQMYNGALTYWPGGSYASWWGSVYATHFLLEAKKKGFEVDQNVLDKLMGYLKNQIRRNNTYEYYYYDVNNKLVQRRVAPRDAFYSLFVLAMAGQPDVASMNYYKAKPELLTADSRYMLACSYLLTGDKSSFKLILPGGFPNERSFTSSSRNFYSHIRDQGIALSVL